MVIAPEVAGSVSLGHTITALGDVNNDGIDDFAIGSTNAFSGLGATYVIFGTATGFPVGISLAALDGTNGFKIAGSSAAGNLGRVARIGDVNSDGYDDILVGGPTTNVALVVYGGPTGSMSLIATDPLDPASGATITGSGFFGGQSPPPATSTAMAMKIC